MAEQELYSDHLDTLLALVTHLAMTRFRSRTPSRLAKYLSLDKDEIILVLESFKGLFRKSVSISEETGEHFYTLQLRYARRWLREQRGRGTEAEEKITGEDKRVEDDDPDNREPLEAEYLSALLSFISEMVEQEQTSKRQRLANWITFAPALIAAVAATVAAIVSYIGLSVPAP